MPFFRQITTYLSIEFKIKNGAPVFWHRWAWQKSLYRSILSIALTRPRSSSIIPIIIGVVGMIPTRNTLVGCIIQSGSRRGGRPLCRKRKYYVLILRKNFHFFFFTSWLDSSQVSIPVPGVHQANDSSCCCSCCCCCLCCCCCCSKRRGRCSAPPGPNLRRKWKIDHSK